MELIKKKIIKPILDRVFFYFETKRKSLVNERKKILLNSLQSCGKGVRLNGVNHFFSKPDKLILGNNIHIGSNAFFKTEGGLVIGDNVHISRNLTVYTVNHNYNASALPYDNTTSYKPVIIEKNVWIGMNVSIIPGVTIGEGAIIGLGTVVNRNIKPFEIVGTVKVITIKERDRKHYKILKEKKAFGGINGKLLKEDYVNNFFESYFQNKSKQIVFILGTGRSGTHSITKILNQHPSCKAFHEDIKQLIRISTDLAYNNDNDKLFKELEIIFQTKIWNASNDQVLIHTDQRLWNLVPFLSNYFPNSKFIHLKREPISCIKSMVLRDWYQENEYPKFSTSDWAKYRIKGDKLGLFTVAEWKKMSSIEKCNWYYNHINDSIENQLKELDPARTLFLNLENINDSLEILQSFIGVRKLDLEVIKSNIMRDVDKLKISKININDLEEKINAAHNTMLKGN